MKIFGIFEVHRLRRHPDSGHRELPWDDLIRDLSPAASRMVAKVARGEVKNYLAELAEHAGVPFGSAAEFVRLMNRPLVFHGDDCPGHTTGTPGESCLRGES